MTLPIGPIIAPPRAFAAGRRLACGLRLRLRSGWGESNREHNKDEQENYWKSFHVFSLLANLYPAGKGGSGTDTLAGSVSHFDPVAALSLRSSARGQLSRSGSRLEQTQSHACPG